MIAGFCHLCHVRLSLSIWRWERRRPSGWETTMATSIPQPDYDLSRLGPSSVLLLFPAEQPVQCWWLNTTIKSHLHGTGQKKYLIVHTDSHMLLVSKQWWGLKEIQVAVHLGVIPFLQKVYVIQETSVSVQTDREISKAGVIHNSYFVEHKL